MNGCSTVRFIKTVLNNSAYKLFNAIDFLLSSNQ